jgi:hypothetical protein
MGDLDFEAFEETCRRYFNFFDKEKTKDAFIFYKAASGAYMDKEFVWMKKRL